MKEPIILTLELDQVDYLLDFLGTHAEDDPYLQEIVYSMHEQAYRWFSLKGLRAFLRDSPTLNFTIATSLMKYFVELSSGRDFVMETEGSVYDIAYDAYEEACLMDDYLVNVTPICDV